MLRSTARIDTVRGERYRDQLARHGAGMLRKAREEGGAGMPPIRETSTVEGAVVLDLAWGRCTVRAEPDALVLVAEAATAADLERIQAGVGSRVTRIGRRDGLTATWSAVEGDPASEVDSPPARHGSIIGGTAIAVILAMVIVVHLGLGAALLRAHWAWWALLALGIVVVAKLVVVRHFTGRFLGHRIGGHLPAGRKRR
ncbi:hypothetical protein GCM10022215_37860 [Nocardioides fonticola]|uniref:DUF2218 domain-containing protein n=1 Tax=Nocardioides fonticola TaxID=450363 RepID=A0ABP7XY16_9ACTN